MTCAQRSSADPHALADVVAELLGNAIASGGSRIVVQGRRERDAIEIHVEDDGPGVPAAIESRLFQPFVTGRGRDARYPGTGLGLAIAKRWMERHGGTIQHQRPARAARDS